MRDTARRSQGRRWRRPALLGTAAEHERRWVARRRPSGELGFDDWLHKEIEEGHEEVRHHKGKELGPKGGGAVGYLRRNRGKTAAATANSGERIPQPGGTKWSGRRGKK